MKKKITPCFSHKLKYENSCLFAKNNFRSFGEISLKSPPSYWWKAQWDQDWVKDERTKWPNELKLEIDKEDWYYKIKEAFKKVKDHCNLSSVTLELNCGKINVNRDFCNLIRELRNLPRLKKLNLKFHSYGNKDDENYDVSLEVFKTIFSQFKYLKKISHLEIKTFMKISNDCLSLIADGIKHLRKLSSFCLNSELLPDSISPATIEKLAFGISCFEKLSRLDLRLKGVESLDSKTSKTLWNSFSRLENLISLQIKVFSLIDLDKSSIEALFKSLKYLKKLSVLSLDFAAYRKEMNIEMIEALLHGFKYLGKFPQQALKNIEKRYFGLNLSELYVSFPQISALTEKSIKAFAKCLISMKTSLKCLSLDFTKLEDKTNEEMLEFLKHLSSLETLKTLDLRFSGRLVTDDFLKDLSFRWSFLQNLSDLKLYFDKSSQVTNKGLKALSKGLAWTENLTHLDLYFGRLPKVSMSSIDDFFFWIGDIMNLRYLKLDFSEYSQVTDKTIASLSEALSSLDKLEFLDLDFSYCENFTNQGLDNLANGLSRLAKLRSFGLDIHGFRKINEKGIEYLVEGLQDLPNLKRSWLDIYGNYSISEDFMWKLYKKLRRIGFCYSLEQTYDICKETGHLFIDTRGKRKE